MCQTSKDIPIANSYTFKLLEQAQQYWSEGEPIPLDLFAEMNEAGMNVESLETKYKQ